MHSRHCRFNPDDNVAYGVLRGISDEFIDDEAKWDAECRRCLEHGALNDDGTNGRIVEEKVRKIIAQALDIFFEFDSLLAIETMELTMHAPHGADTPSRDA